MDWRAASGLASHMTSLAQRMHHYLHSALEAYRALHATTPLGLWDCVDEVSLILTRLTTLTASVTDAHHMPQMLDYLKLADEDLRVQEQSHLQDFPTVLPGLDTPGITHGANAQAKHLRQIRNSFKPY